MKSTKPTLYSTYLAAAAGLFITYSVVRYPEAVFTASLDGLRLWFDIVLPALLPFFTIAGILHGLGVIHAVGVLLEPLMRPVFRMPGASGFAVAIGLASGYPLGAKITGDLKREGLCTREEAERTVSFANTADPLFMVGAVAVGMFGMPQLGVTIVAAHYISALLVGFVMRYHARGVMGKAPPPAQGALFPRALAAMIEARKADARPIGALFSDSVRSSINSMLFVGGCIMMFSVFLRILTITAVVDWISIPFGAILIWAGVAPEIISALIMGFVEITIGTQAASVAETGLVQKALAASAIIGWSGFSVHAQVAAMLHGTDVRMLPYLTARLIHAISAAILTVLLFEPLGGAAAAISGGPLGKGALQLPPLLVYWGGMGIGMVVILAVMLSVSLIIYSLRHLKVIIFRV